MKIKILKNIPGYKAGEIIEKTHNILSIGFAYLSDELVKQGFAEEIKEVDIEAIRKQYQYDMVLNVAFKNLPTEQIVWFTSYRIVKYVIDQLNGDWKPDFDSEDFNKKGFGEIWYNKAGNNFGMTRNIKRLWTSILPPINFDAENALKIILKCEPELKVLFNIN